MSGTATALIPLLVVPHTHWDREWYRPFEAYRYRLVKTLDSVLEANLPYFLLDGQTVAIDDYLAIRPEAESALRARIAEGRLGAGPWYVLVDEFLVSGESLIRNLIEGRKTTQRLGAGSTVGYLPDMFGHIAQMPQILKGFGIEQAVVWRGAHPPAPAFRWRAPDGSEVAAAWLPLGYYQPMFIEGLAPEAQRAQLEAYLKEFAGADRAWLLSGADHMAPRADLMAQLEAVNASDLGLEARVATLADLFEGLAPGAVLEGELRDNSKPLTYLLPGVLSARMYLKQANDACQTLLERYVEPLAALAWAAGKSYPEAFLAHAWRELLKNHPHDSICGCSIDQVHREMMPRFAAVEQIGAELLAEAVGADPRPVASPTLVAFNPTGWAHDGWVETQVEWPLAGAPEVVKLVGPDGAEVPAVITSCEDTEVFKAEIDFNPDWFKVRRFKLGLKAALAPAQLGRWRVEAGAPTPVATGVNVSETTLENERLALRVVTGRLDLEDKASGRVYRDCHGFDDQADAGDEYNFSPIEGDAPIRAVITGQRVVEAQPHRATLEVRYRLALPRGLTADRLARRGEIVDTEIVSRFTLRAGAGALEVETRFYHQALDHRLRVLAGGLAGERPAVWTETPFGVIEREPLAMSPLPMPKRAEAVMPEFPQGRFTALAGAAGGLAVANRGLPEASLVETEHGWALAVTLLRAVGWLSRDDLRTRGGGAGPRFETPEAQCQGEQVFHYALVPFAGEWMAAMPACHQFGAPVRIWSGQGLEGVEAPVATGDDRVVLSALKRSEDGTDLVVRVYNASHQPVEATLRVGLAHGGVYESDLTEQRGALVGQGVIAYRLRPYEIRTWRVAR